MKLFDSFEVVKFYEENLFFVTNNSYIYYIFNPKYNRWYKYGKAGEDSITVSNYDDVTKDELISAMGGVFPQKETDFMRMCDPSQLNISDMMTLLKEEYPQYMDYLRENTCYHIVHRFLSESDICYKSFKEIKKVFERAAIFGQGIEQVFSIIKDLSFSQLGRDIFKKEIEIVDGHDSSSYFWIRPVRVLDYTNTNDMDNVAEMKSIGISIEEDDVSQYLTPFLFKYFDNDFEANKKRIEYFRNDNGKAKIVNGFEWYLTHNFYTFDTMQKILNDINDTIDALTHRRDTEYTSALKEKRGRATHELLYAKNLNEAQIKEYNNNRPTENTTDIELIIDFYRRFIYRMEYMMRVGKEKGYELISFMGP